MNETEPNAEPSPASNRQRTGWTVAIAVFLGLILLTVAVLLVVTLSQDRTWRERDPASLGFNLTPSLIPRDQIVPIGISRDGIHALVEPAVMTAEQVVQVNENERGHYLLPSDPVIGVERNGEARAYPLSILNWHEIVNDTLGGEPIAVTYHPLCQSVVVFDRRVGGGQPRTFGVSGLLYNSNLLMYDDQSESLWSQLQFRAVTGPAAEAGLELTLLPAQLIRWEDWLLQHPETTVLTRDPAYRKLYRRRPYSLYFGSPDLKFPVDPLPPQDPNTPLVFKTPMLAVRGEPGRWAVFPMPWLDHRLDEQNTWIGERWRIHTQNEPPLIWAEARQDGEPPVQVYCFWFAWYAMHGPDGLVVEPE